MAPTPALVKAETDREALKTHLNYYELKLQNHGAQPISLTKLTQYLATSNSIHTRITENYEKIIANVLAADLAPHTAIYGDLLDCVIELECQFEDIKTTLTVIPVIPVVPPSADIRFPRLELPSFSGNLQEWTSFRDIFKNAVDSKIIPKVQTLTYLKASLTGEAARLIQSVNVTDDGYDIAWGQLTDRYQNDRELLFCILRRFFNQQNVQPQSSSSLRILVDTTKECIRSLQALKRPVGSWDDIIIFQLFQKIDPSSRELWEQSLKDSSIPILQDFLEFLEQRARALSAGSSVKQPTKGPQAGRAEGDKRGVNQVHHAQAVAFKVCSKDNHLTYKCRVFNAMSVDERIEAVRKHFLCFKCLRPDHSSTKCPFDRNCKTCNKGHHTLIHKGKESSTQQVAVPLPVNDNTVFNGHTNDEVGIKQTLLATATVNVLDDMGHSHQVRVLLDGGSTTSFVTESCVGKLKLRRGHTSSEVLSLSAASIGTARGVVTMNMSPHFDNNNVFIVRCLILNKITGQLPIRSCDPTVWPHLQGLELADPNFHISANINILLGADIFWNILMDGKRTGPSGTPVGLRSSLGWLVAGNLDCISSKHFSHYGDADLDLILQQFWELESVPSTRVLTTEERACEDHFAINHSIDSSGRFQVKLPRKINSPAIGHSRDIAIRRLKQLERRLSVHVEHRQQYYLDFMRAYLKLGHMIKVPVEETRTPLNPTCYIPHHFVLKESSTTTKFRVVFDASAKTSSGVSLNYTLKVGPVLQENLINILMRFRKHVIAFSTDIVKMYRQILVTSEDADLQRIVWRENFKAPVDEL